MHTEEEYEGASLGLTREEALRQVKEQAQKRAQHLKDFIFTHGEHCSDAELYGAQGELDQLEKHDNTACRAELAPNIVCGRARWKHTVGASKADVSLDHEFLDATWDDED